MSALSTLTTVGVIGAGTMGAGIAQVAAQAGHPVLLFDAAEGAAEVALCKMTESLQRLIERGKFTPEEVEAILSRITAATDIHELSPTGLVIEAIVENLSIKQELFKNLESICQP